MKFSWKLCLLTVCFHSGGKLPSKVEVAINSQRYDAGGDTRKIVTAMINNEKNRQHGHKWMLYKFYWLSSFT